MFRILIISITCLASCICLCAQQQEPWVVEKLPPFINSAYDEIVPVPTRDGRTLFFTRVGYPEYDHTLIFDTINYAKKLKPDQYDAMLKRLYGELGQTLLTDPWRSAFNQDVWMSVADSGSVFVSTTHPGYPLNNALTNSLVATTPEPNTYYVVNQFKPEGDMKRGFSYLRRLADSTWTFPLPVEIKDYYTITSDVSLTMSFDGKVLILAAARFDSRDLDLYICFREGEHKWSSPKNLGTVINSARRELTPYLSEDNNTLYFSSNRTSSSGGLDLYMTRRINGDWFQWTPPIQLIAPINSPSDESQPYFNMTSGYLYFTSKRDGNSDIFRVRIAPPQPTEVVIKGRVLNSQARQLLPCVVHYGTPGSTGNIVPAPDGTFTMRIPKGVKMELTPRLAGFTGRKDSMYFRQDYYYFKDYYTVDLYLDPLQVDSKIELPTLLFQQSTANILPESLPELDQLADLLNTTPGIEVRIEGHTDNVGKVGDLQQLSEERALAVRQYLIDKGIIANRIQAIGRGAADPVNDNSTDELRKLNRRVVVVVTKI